MVKNFKSLLTNEEVTNENENHKKKSVKDKKIADLEFIIRIQDFK
jgi:hypothetical protein